MNGRSTTADLKRKLRQLFRSMDFVSGHPALKRAGPEAERLAEIYQQLGLAWEFLALQCRHRGGWRKTREGKFACKVCGLIRGASESWLLLPREGKKRIGHRAMATSMRTFPMNPEAEDDVRKLRQAITEARALLGDAAEKLRAVLGDEAIMPETPVEAEAAMESAVEAIGAALRQLDSASPAKRSSAADGCLPVRRVRSKLPP
jgi:hypothetical protein